MVCTWLLKYACDSKIKVKAYWEEIPYAVLNYDIPNVETGAAV